MGFGGHIVNGIMDFMGANVPGWTCNLGISYAAGVFTITDAQGSTLTPWNPGWVTVPSTTAGRLATLKVKTAASFNDDAHASSHLTNFGFGITEAAHWANDMPFFLYVINRANSNLDGADGSSVFAISRNPCMVTSPSAANNIGDTGAASVTDDQTSILILDDVTVANYTSLPCQLIGAFRMQWSTTSDDWTVQTLGNSDGLGSQALRATFSKTWTMPAGQNGASASTYLHPNTGTAPVFLNNLYTYQIFVDGTIELKASLDGDGGANGAGAVNARMALPTNHLESQSQIIQIGEAYVSDGTEEYVGVAETAGTSTVNALQVRVHDDTGGAIQSTTSIVNNALFAAGRDWRVTARYKAYA